MKNTIIILKKIIKSKWKPLIKKIIRVYQTPSVSKIIKSWNRKEIEAWPLPSSRGREQGIENYEYSIFSQNGEDGILRYLFSEIGFRSKLFMEFGFGITQNNSLRLILHERFGGVFIDGSKLTVRRLNNAVKKCGLLKVKAIHKLLNLKNLEPTIQKSGLPKEIDLLSIDVDGNDYWFWEGISCLNPRVVVIEYNASLGPELSLSVPYDPTFDRFKKHVSGFYCGASITALNRLGKKKGYALVGCDSKGVNAFFVRKDCLTQSLNVLTPQNAFHPITTGIKRGLSLEEQFNTIKDLPYTEIK